jgi:hypothetical protein
MLEQVMVLRGRGSPGAHLGVSMLNTSAFGFYQRLGFRELIRVGAGRGLHLHGRFASERAIQLHWAHP